MTNLEKMIKNASQKYYSDGTSNLTDSEFDEALNQLREENPNSELLTDVGHGYDEYVDTTPGKRCKHKYGLIKGLDKIHNWKELSKEFHNQPTLASVKLDGLSIVMYYKNGEMIQALTRGGTSGETGIDVTEKVKYMYDTPTLRIRGTFTGAIRGEILMTSGCFEKYKEIHANENKVIKNSRNTAAGIMNNKEVIDDLKLLSIYVYNVVAYETDKLPFETPKEMMEWLQVTSSFPVVGFSGFSKSTMNEGGFENRIRAEKRFIDDAYNIIPSDGIVLNLNTKDGLHFNKETKEITYVAEAFKFPSQAVVTEVEDIEWSLTKNRRCVPRVKVKEIDLCGSTINYCTGNNAQYLIDNGIVPGAIIEISKHGEVIPNIDKVLSAPKIQVDKYIPQVCPICKEPLSWIGVDIVCKNNDCANAKIRDVYAWFNYIAPMEAFGDKLLMKYLQQVIPYRDISVESIMENDELQYVRSIVHDKMSIHEKLFAKRLYKLFIGDDSNPKDISVYDALMALNVPRLGDITCRKIADKYPWILRDLMEISIENYATTADLSSVEYFNKIRLLIGDANTNSIESHIWKFTRLRYISNRIDFEITKESTDKGKVAITGKLSVKRSEFERELRDAGYTPRSISKDTKFLITDDPNSDSDKNKKADKWNIVKICETEFRQKYL